MRVFLTVAFIVFSQASLAADLGFSARQDGTPPPGTEPFRMATSFTCANVSCKKLSSCEEACYKLIQCGQSIRDRDNDGIPCENLCSRPCPR
ncbi:MAG: excalibur calcium-binding domain-containing protein [Maritimibacter sp.]|nr:excalibur calcium-binding domain-containing protein [Maritimibacter sp.]